ncbi:MAG TPA: class I SAM-dependent methyltransferase [Bacteroidia bacterium]|nr:class I SAM-dependent methyltransferase [Bacteroidia bacterium]
MSQRVQSANEEDLVRLKRMLRKVAGRDPELVKRRLERAGEARVLDLACGDCREARVLGDFAAELKGSAETTVSLTGIDVRAREIADAARKHGRRSRADDARGAREHEFLVGDATRLNELRELGEDFDLVFLRHQNYWNGGRDWEEIFDHALSKLGPDGRLVITSYFDKEHSLALEAIQRLGGELVATESNPETRQLATPGKSVDRHMAMFRRVRK